MTKYLIRRRNEFGQYIHLATWDIEPTDSQMESYFGPGDYTILTANEGLIGLRKLRDVTIAWKVDFLGWTDGMPTTEYIQQNYGEGNYYVLTNCEAKPFQIFPQNQPHDLAWQNLIEGASAMKGISIIFRVRMPWV
jgi:hypothetical protein